VNERIIELALQAGLQLGTVLENYTTPVKTITIEQRKFAQLIVRECVDKIETYRIPVGNSAAGEMACEWTYDALKEIRDEIREHFGVGE
jgi:hypothetical protein